MRKSLHSKHYEKLLAQLKIARKEAGLTQTEVARHFGTYASYVSKIESGERRLDVVELSAICRLYGVRLSSFLKKAGLE